MGKFMSSMLVIEGGRRMTVRELILWLLNHPLEARVWVKDIGIEMPEGQTTLELDFSESN